MYLFVEGPRLWEEGGTPRVLYKTICRGLGFQSACWWPDELLYINGDVTVIRKSSFIQLQFHDQVRLHMLTVSNAQTSPWRCFTLHCFVSTKTWCPTQTPQVETELEVNEKGEYLAPAGYIRAMSKLVGELLTRSSPGNILLLGVGGGSFFQELRHHHCAGCKVLSFNCYSTCLWLNNRDRTCLWKPSLSEELGLGALKPTRFSSSSELRKMGRCLS